MTLGDGLLLDLVGDLVQLLHVDPGLVQRVLEGVDLPVEDLPVVGDLVRGLCVARSSKASNASSGLSEYVTLAELSVRTPSPRPRPRLQ